MWLFIWVLLITLVIGGFYLMNRGVGLVTSSLVIVPWFAWELLIQNWYLGVKNRINYRFHWNWLPIIGIIVPFCLKNKLEPQVETQDFVRYVKKSGIYVGSLTRTTYHYPNCRHVRKIRTEKLSYFNSAKEAKNKRYLPCHSCLPPE